MTHSMLNKSDQQQVAYLDLLTSMRNWLRGNVINRVNEYFFGLLDAPVDFLRRGGIDHLYLGYFGTATSGYSYWNGVHVDDDVWITIMVSFGNCEAGGDLIHPPLGRGHRLMEGDILIVNPAMPHATTEFLYAEGTCIDRFVLALFVKKDCVSGAVTASAVAERCDLSTFTPRKRR